jgi:16S rRNA processing protein RimM
MPSAPDHTLVELAVIVRPHGVRGAVKARLHNPDTDMLTRGRQVHVAGVARLVTGIQPLPDPRALVLHLEGVSDRDAAEALRDAPVSVRRDELPPLAEGEYYHFELIGARVETPDGELLGTVERVLTTNIDNLELRRPDGRELLIPVLDPFVKHIDRAAGRVIAVEPEWE